MSISKNENSAKQNIILKEYGFAEKLRESYFKNSWVATSIILPISWGLVGLSYTEPVLALNWFQLLPLAFASIALFLFWFWYVLRYSGYLNIIYTRFWKLEEQLKMNLHIRIRNEGPKSWWRIRYLNIIIGFMLGAAWMLRILGSVWMP
jgi:hypothetical protein